jgi:hypothetical protein
MRAPRCRMKQNELRVRGNLSNQLRFSNPRFRSSKVSQRARKYSLFSNSQECYSEAGKIQIRTGDFPRKVIF